MTSLAEQQQAHADLTAQLRLRAGKALRFILTAGLAALALRSFVYEPFSLPSRSMQPTLLPGDTIFIAKWPYGISRHSLPLGGEIIRFSSSARLFGRLPARGDVIVFTTPRDGQTHYVKRVIGLPGDIMAMADGVPALNGIPLSHSPLSHSPAVQGASPSLIIETLPQGQSYTVHNGSRLSARETFGPVTVPPGQLFLLGDNRDASADSRYSLAEGGIGMVPLGNVVGRADVIINASNPARIGTRL